MNLLKLLSPGLHLKRWVGLLLFGLVATSLGFAYLLVQIYRTQPFPDWVGVLTLQFIDRPIRGGLFLLVGVICLVYGFVRLNQSLIEAVRPEGQEGSWVDAVYNRRKSQRGPRIVAIGGGTGLSTLLRGLKQYSSNITAIVTVADDGGSSGRLRRELGVLPPGDFRNCIVALADAEPLMARLFQYRFGQGSGLDGHSFGNLFIVAMSGVTGNFEQAIRESSRVLAVRGQILPSTLQDVTLCAELEDAVHVAGESAISKSTRPIKRVYLKPERPPAHPDAVRAILEADLIVVGPGSLYTSVMPNLLVEAIARALQAATAPRVYVCNVATQRGETDDYSVADHIRALLRQLPSNPFDYVLANSRTDLPIPAEWKVRAVMPNGLAEAGPAESVPRLVLADVVDETNPLRHDPAKLAEALIKLYDEHLARAQQGRNGRAGRQERELVESVL